MSLRDLIRSFAAALVGAALCAQGLLPPAAAGTGGPTCTEKTPVLVVGGTPAGVAAAIAAARLGSPVILTEARPYLGGDLTGAMLNMFDMNFGPNRLNLSQGIFLEIYHQLGMTFDVELAKHVFLQAVRREPLISLHLLTRPAQVVVDGGRIAAVVTEGPGAHQRETICGKRIVDATDDADIAAMAGVPYTLGREGSGVDRAMQAATLVFELSGVNWHDVLAYIAAYRGRLGTRGGIYHGNVWGYGEIMRGYHPTQPGLGIYDLNIGRQNDTSVLINGLLIYGVDGTDPASVAEAMQRARVELPRLIAYLRARAPGFENADLVRTADYLYIRETRHIQGLQLLTAQDIVNSRVFWDAVGVASYPIDLHPYRPGELNPWSAQRFVYTIPLGALVPLAIDNLLVASRSISASYEAAGSARVVPTTMEEGQAAGAAAVLSIESKQLIPRFAGQPSLVHELQSTLHAQGAYLLPETLAAVGGPERHWPGAARSPIPPPAQTTTKRP